MNYSEMLSELSNAAPAATLDGIEALRTTPRIERSGLRSEPVPENLRKVPLTGAAISGLMQALAPIISKHVADKIEDAVRPLRQQIEDLQARPVPRWRGVFVVGAQYQQLEFVVDRGGLWICRVSTTTSRPGSNEDWQLCCKRGAHDG